MGGFGGGGGGLCGLEVRLDARLLQGADGQQGVRVAREAAAGRVLEVALRPKFDEENKLFGAWVRRVLAQEIRVLDSDIIVYDEVDAEAGFGVSRLDDRHARARDGLEVGKAGASEAAR